MTKTEEVLTIESDNAFWNSDQRSVWDFIGGSLAVLWKGWCLEMNPTILDAKNSRFSLSGKCPHCDSAAAFLPVGSIHNEHIRDPKMPGVIPGFKLVAAMQCQGCREYILGAIRQDAADREKCTYLFHYPLGTPNEAVSEHIPEHIAADFKEAKRCRWVKAYNATVEMCRRALQSSCDDLKAQGSNLYEQIDDLATKGIITKPLKEMAHKIRLGGNRGAHPSSKQISERDADAAITFTRHYFEHVYEMPAALAAVDFEKPTA